MRNPFDLERRDVLGSVPLNLQRLPASSGISVISWIGEASTAYDVRGKEGTAALTCRLLKSGTQHRSKKDLAKLLDRWAATLSVEVDGDASTVEIRGPTVIEDRLVDLLCEVVFEPAFPAEEVSRARRISIERLRRELTQPAPLSERRFLEALFPPGHPYHYSPLGTVRSVGQLTAKHLREFHRKHYTIEGSRFAVTTSRDPTEVVRTLERSLRAHPPSEGALERPAFSARKKSPGPAVLQYRIAGSQQVSLVVGGIAPPIVDPSRAPLELAHEVLGSRPILSRLFQVVREQNGLAYYADSSLHMLREAGYWLATAGTATETSSQVQNLLLREVRRLGEEKVASSELDSIRNSLLGSLPLLLDTPPSAHTLAQEVTIYGLPPDHFLRWPDALRRVTPQEIRSAVQEHLGGWNEPLQVIAGPQPSAPKS